jgi:hypothetical protein
VSNKIDRPQSPRRQPVRRPIGGRRRRLGGFIFIWGRREYTFRKRSEPPVDAKCPMCRQSARLVAKVSAVYFHMWFIPITALTEPVEFTHCTSCKADINAPIASFRSKTGDEASFPAAIALYNQMRETPDDSAKLLKLMSMYAELNEPGEAISAGAAFPEALKKSQEAQSVLAAIIARSEAPISTKQVVDETNRNR